jgi:hypothetical protein
MPEATSNGKTLYQVKGRSIEACNCEHGCNCQFGGFPNEGKCEFIIGYDINQGHFGSTKLDGLRAVVAGKYPKAIHEGNGHLVLFVDAVASDEQVAGLVGILSGQNGGMPWEALGGTIGKLEGPVRKPIQIKHDGTKSEIRIEGALTMQLKPLVNPVTGKENDVRITYPKGGFFWDEGAIATTEAMNAKHGDFSVNWPNRFAAVADIHWTNQQ